MPWNALAGHETPSAKLRWWVANVAGCGCPDDRELGSELHLVLASTGPAAVEAWARRRSFPAFVPGHSGFNRRGGVRVAADAGGSGAANYAGFGDLPVEMRRHACGVQAAMGYSEPNPPPTFRGPGDPSVAYAMEVSRSQHVHQVRVFGGSLHAQTLNAHWAQVSSGTLSCF